MRIALIICSASLILSSILIITEGSELETYTNNISGVIIMSAIVISFWTITYSFFILCIILLFNRLRRVETWGFIRTELIIFSLTILSSFLFILTIAFVGK